MNSIRRSPQTVAAARITQEHDAQYPGALAFTEEVLGEFRSVEHTLAYTGESSASQGDRVTAGATSPSRSGFPGRLLVRSTVLWRRSPSRYSHSMVPGGLLVTSIATRLISRTSLVIRVEIVSITSYGSLAQSAVIASSDVTGRSTTGWP